MGLYQPGTCKWILNSGQWATWTEKIKETSSSDSRGMWIYGIPGAGKTILAAFIAKTILGLRDVLDDSDAANANLPCASAYYYCFHGRNHDETGPFLRWLLSQLGRQADFVPRKVGRLYQTDCQPTMDELLDGIKEISVLFSKVLISIDAVDESENREVLATLLQSMANSKEFGNFHIVILSRREQDIERHMTSFIKLSMSNQWVDNDIADYIDVKLRALSSFQRWSPSLQDDIKQTLSAKANGM